MNGPDSSFFCCDTGLIRSRSIFPVCFSTSFKNQNTCFKNHAVEAAVPVFLVTLTSTFIGFTPRDLAEFLQTSFLEWKQSPDQQKTITVQCFSCQNKSVCQKLAQSCKKWKFSQRAIYSLFAPKPSITTEVIILCVVLHSTIDCFHCHAVKK